MLLWYKYSNSRNYNCISVEQGVEAPEERCCRNGKARQLREPKSPTRSTVLRLVVTRLTSIIPVMTCCSNTKLHLEYRN